MLTHVPECEQHRKSQSQKCGNAHSSVWVNVSHMSKRAVQLLWEQSQEANNIFFHIYIFLG